MLGNTNKRSLSEWTQLLGNAIAHYIRVYQASSFTVFGGKRTPKGHGEAPALDKLTKWNAGKETVPSQDEVVQTVIKLLDIIPSLDLKTKEKGLKDWSAALSTLFPDLFAKGWLKELQPQDISTLAQRTTKDELAKKIRGTGSSLAIMVEDEDIEEVEMKEVETEEEEKKAGEGEEAESIREPFVVVASVDTTLPETGKQKFSADKITVAMVMIPDERPSTQFKSGQGSHTIAWSLERRAWESLFGAGQLLKEVMDNLKKTLDADTDWEKETKEVKEGKSQGLSSSRTALKQEVAANETSVVEHSLSDWTKLLNEWIKRYVEIYQKSSFATFTETEKSGATTPTGHGEGFALGELDRWEALLKKDPNGTTSKHPSGEEVAKKALALLDIGTWAVTRTNVAIKELLERWKDDFERAFPKVFGMYQKDIEDALDTLQKSEADPFDPNAPRGERKRKLTAFGVASAKKRALAGTH